MIMTTIDTVPGFVIERTMGLLVASIPFVVSKYEEGVKDLHGNTQPDVPANLEKRRSEALSRLERKARQVHANAVVGVRFDVREIGGAWRELCAYGTAVVIV